MSGYQGGGLNYQGQGGRSGGRSGGRGRGHYQGGRDGGGVGGGGRDGGGGRGRGPGRGRGGTGGGSNTLYTPCNAYTTSGNCAHGTNCKFAHIVTLHKVFCASSFVQGNNHNNRNNYNNNNNNNNNNSAQKAAVSSVAIWEMNGIIQIFTGSHDGFWRMWNTAQGSFSKAAETNMKGKVECLRVFQNSFLYCGYEAVSKLLPEVPVGLVNMWNLQNATAQPLELQMGAQHFLPYAHNQAVTAVVIGDGGMVVTGARDGSIRLWTLQTDGSCQLIRSLPGHVREITDLVLIPGGSMLWSSSTDGSIRIWDLSQSVPEMACQYCITRDTPGQVPPSTSGQAPAPQQHAGIGHVSAVTALVLFPSPSGNFVLSSSLDGTIKAWDASTGACVANESHTEGVVTMALGNASSAAGSNANEVDMSGQPVLLIGLESGNIACRNLTQTQNTPAFTLLFVLSQKYTAGHSGAVKAITAGPAATFYTGGYDGNLMVWQFTGDLHL